MKTPELRDIVIRVFHQLQQRGVKLGLRELLDAIKLVETNYAGDDAARLQQAIRVLWCRSPEEEFQFDRRWSAVMAAFATEQQETSPSRASASLPEPEFAPERAFPSMEMIAPQEAIQGVAPEWSAYPVSAPFTPTSAAQHFDLQS